MPTKADERPAFPCLACIRERGRPDNDWYVELARVVIQGKIQSDELWTLLRKREGQHSHRMIVRIITCMADNDAGLDEKCERITRIIHSFGFPRSEDQHNCGKKEARAHTA